MKIVLISHDNGVGLSRDAAILTEVLTSRGHEVAFLDYRQPTGPSADAVIFLEVVAPQLLDSAPRKILIPNPEYFRPEWLPLLPEFTLVAAKTRHAAEIFGKLHPNVVHTGFTSIDRYDPSISKTRGFCHLPGKSITKNSEAVLSTFSGLNEDLLVVHHPERRFSQRYTRSVAMLGAYLPDAVHRSIVNAYAFHVMPSRAEGWGHAIVEAMSAGAVVITLDAPPMNEHVQPGRGLLVEAVEQGPMGLSQTYAPSIPSLLNAINVAKNLSDAEISSIGGAARDYFIQTDTHFRSTFPDVVENL